MKKIKAEKVSWRGRGRPRKDESNLDGLPKILQPHADEAFGDKSLQKQLKADSRYTAKMTAADQQILMRARRDAVIAAVAELTLHERVGRIGHLDRILTQVEELTLIVKEELMRLPIRLSHMLVGHSAREMEKIMSKEIQATLQKLNGMVLRTVQQPSKGKAAVPDSVKLPSSVARSKREVGVYRAG